MKKKKEKTTFDEDLDDDTKKLNKNQWKIYYSFNINLFKNFFNYINSLIKLFNFIIKAI